MIPQVPYQDKQNETPEKDMRDAHGKGMSIKNRITTSKVFKLDKVSISPIRAIG